MTTGLFLGSGGGDLAPIPDNSFAPEEHFSVSISIADSLPVIDEILKDRGLTLREKANAILKLNITALRP